MRRCHVPASDRKSCHTSIHGAVAQMVERSLCMREVQGSIPCSSIPSRHHRLFFLFFLSVWGCRSRGNASDPCQVWIRMAGVDAVDENNIAIHEWKTKANQTDETTNEDTMDTTMEWCIPTQRCRDASRDAKANLLEKTGRDRASSSTKQPEREKNRIPDVSELQAALRSQGKRTTIMSISSRHVHWRRDREIPGVL